MTHPQQPEPQQPGLQQPQQPEQQQPQYAPPQYGGQQVQQYGQQQYALPLYAPPVSQPHPAAWSAAEPGPGEPFDGAADPDDLLRPLYGASFGASVRRFFRGYVRFSGRASRSEFWWTQLFLALVLLLPLTIAMIGYFGIIAEAIANAPEPPLGMFALVLVGFGLSGLISLGLLLPMLALSWRRIQDANLPGPLCFLHFVPYVGPLIVLVFGFLPPAPPARRFDPPRVY